MKSFALVSSLAAHAYAARFLPTINPSRGFVEGSGRNGTNGQMARFAGGNSLDVFNNSAIEGTQFIWTITAWSVFYEDSGTTRLRLIHNLEADIFATDTVNFEISFRPDNLPDPTDTASIGEDYVSCDMSQSSTDGAFWSASIAEGMYVCKGADATDTCAYITDDADYEQNPESTSDWVTPYSDDDKDDFWCTKQNTTIGATLSPFECSAIQCVIERDMDTGDEDNDLRFTPTPGSPDYLVIKPGRAKLYINKTLANFATEAEAHSGVYPTVTSASFERRIKVSTGATGLLSAVSAATIAVAALAF